MKKKGMFGHELGCSVCMIKTLMCPCRIGTPHIYTILYKAKTDFNRFEAIILLVSYFNKNNDFNRGFEPF